MCRNDEICSFEAILGERTQIRFIEKRQHFDKAPYGIDRDAGADAINDGLLRFFNKRSLPAMRRDYMKILEFTGAKNSIDLVFRGHGLSLSDHYWFKREGEDLRYEDINFFTNKWDDSFARAVLSDDYEALSRVSLNVPDIVTDGWGVKGWLCEEDGPKLYKIGIHEGHCEEALAEVLCSKLAQRMFRRDEFWEYRLKEIYGKYASVSDVVIGIDEELVPLSSVVPSALYDLYYQRNKNKEAMSAFLQRIDECGLPGMREFFVKLSCWRSLCFVNDMHFDNLCAIRNIKTGEIRLAPALDFGGAFGSGETGRKLLSNINRATYVLVYFTFGDIQPEWDYSWYDPRALDGFEDEIRETLSKSDFYTPQLIDNILDVYRHQKTSLNEMAGKR